MSENTALREALVKTGVSFEKLAKVAGVCSRTLWRAMAGHAVDPLNAKTILDTLALMGVSPDSITIATRNQGRPRKK